MKWVRVALAMWVILCGNQRITAAERAIKRGSAAAPALAPEAAQASGITAETALAARNLYTTKCMRCHKSYDPAEYSQPQWDSWMMKMRKKARLSPAQDRLLSQYLDAYRAVAPVARTNASR